MPKFEIQFTSLHPEDVGTTGLWNVCILRLKWNEFRLLKRRSSVDLRAIIS